MEGPGGSTVADRGPLPYFRPNWGPKGRKKIFWDPPPPPSPYRKVWIRFWSGPPIRSDACLKLKFLHRQRYPSRGRFSKYLFWNRLCLRFDKAPRTALQRTISTDRKKISSGTHGNDLFASTRKAVFPAPTATDVHLKQRRRRRQRERHNSSRSRLAKQQRCTCITLFCTFPCRHCTTTTFLEENTRTTTFFSFPELRYRLLEFNSRKNCQHLTNWTRWNKHDKVWNSARDFFL